MRRRVVHLYIKETKNNEVILSLAWNIIFNDKLKVLVLKFLKMKNMVFLSQKVDGNMIFSDYWKVLVLVFFGMGNTVFSWAKELRERWYLLITEKVLFWTFPRSEIRSFFWSRNWWKDDIYWLLRISCFEIFGDVKYGLFFSQNVDGKIIFSWSFWALFDIPAPGKYGFSRSVSHTCSSHKSRKYGFDILGNCRLQLNFAVLFWINDGKYNSKLLLKLIFGNSPSCFTNIEQGFPTKAISEIFGIFQFDISSLNSPKKYLLRWSLAY